MELPRSSAVADLVYLPQTASTNDDLLARVGNDPGLKEFSAVVTTSQTAGRGRLGRVWVAPPGQTLAASVLLKPRLPTGEVIPLNAFGWLPLLAGLAMTRSITALLPASTVSLKWPNDVLVDGKKISGLLSELLPAADGVIIGSGVNLAIPLADLPTPVSTSLGLNEPVFDAVVQGGIMLGGQRLTAADLTSERLIDEVFGGYLEALRDLYTEFLSVGADAAVSGLLDDVSERCSSLGQQVRVELPDGSTLLGVAIDLDPTGRLRVKSSADGTVVAVAAGDVTHLRYE